MILITKTSDSRQWNTYTALRIHLFDPTLFHLLSFVFSQKLFAKNVCRWAVVVAVFCSFESDKCKWNSRTTLTSRVVICDVTCTPKHFWHHTFWPPLRHQRLSPPTGGVADQSFSILQQKVPSTANARGNKLPLSRTLRSENPRTHESRFGLSEFTNVGKVFCVESCRLNASRFELPVLDHLFQLRHYLISLCRAIAYALPTQNGNYQLLRCID